MERAPRPASLGEIRIPNNNHLGKAVRDAILFIESLLTEAGLECDVAAITWLSTAVQIAQLRPHWTPEHKKAFLRDLSTVKAAFYAASNRKRDRGHLEISQLLVRTDQSANRKRIRGVADGTRPSRRRCSSAQPQSQMIRWCA